MPNPTLVHQLDPKGVEKGAKDLRHIQIDGAVRGVERACADLGDFVARVRGDKPRDCPVEAREPTPSLCAVLSDTQVRLALVQCEIHKHLEELSDLLF